MLDLRPASARGVVDYGWLRSNHSFSFGHYYDPQQMGFSDLRVINDDFVGPGYGFESHPHRNMEIFSYVLSGAMAHQDSTGVGSVIRPGDVQVMSAGRGIRHSEFNASATEPMRFLQIWIVPDRTGVEPRYQQAHFSEAERRGHLRLILSPDGAQDSLLIYQDARVYVGLFNGDEQQQFALPENRFAYVQVARGSLVLNGQRLQEGDGVRLRQVQTLHFSEGQHAEVVVFDLRPHE